MVVEGNLLQIHLNCVYWSSGCWGVCTLYPSPSELCNIIGLLILNWAVVVVRGPLNIHLRCVQWDTGGSGNLLHIYLHLNYVLHACWCLRVVVVVGVFFISVWTVFKEVVVVEGGLLHIHLNCVHWSFVSIYRNERALWSKSKTWNKLKFSDLPGGVNLTPLPPPPSPHSKLPEDRVNSLLFNVTNESPFETVN